MTSFTYSQYHWDSANYKITDPFKEAADNFVHEMEEEGFDVDLSFLLTEEPAPELSQEQMDDMAACLRLL